MRILARIFAVGCIVLACAASRADDAALEPGMWRITLTSTTNGVPDPDQDFQQCLGEELKDLAAYFSPQLEGGEAQCERTREPSNENEVRYRMQCRGAAFTVDASAGVTVESPTHFTMTMQIDSRAEEEAATVVAEGEGQRVGDCTEK